MRLKRFLGYQLSVCSSLSTDLVMQEFNRSVPCKHLKFNNGATLATIDPGGRPVVCVSVCAMQG